jgi:four helix bundle protein
LSVRSYRDLLVWQKAMELVIESYRLCRQFPKSELFGLVVQTQRAAVSVPANIAEGHGREHLGDYLRHLSIANGSLMELETHLLIACRLGYLTEAEAKQAFALTSEVGKMLTGLTRSLKPTDT